MAFLDNSGDIILDAVLTDYGRLLLAKGNGSFKISKFALGDDEINYQLFNRNHPSGSSYYDLDILQTPVLEAFTDNAASMKAHLLTITNPNHLYLPVLQLFSSTSTGVSSNSDSFEILVDENTVKAVKGTEDASAGSLSQGLMNGYQPGDSGNHIVVDQGIQTYNTSPSEGLDSDLLETSYLIQIDNRLGRIVTPAGNPSSNATLSYVDDDNIATYLLTATTDTAYVSSLSATDDSDIMGPRGTRVRFRLGAQTALRTNNHLFSVLGSTGTYAIGSMGSATWKFIDTIISVTGQNLGYRIDIPVRFVKEIT